MIIPIMGGIAAAVIAGYNTMSPTSQLYGRTFIGEPGRSRRLALTFDDGPNDPHTQRLLDVLARHQVRATFFMIGSYVKSRPDLAHAVVAAGHEVGNHTLTHPNLIFRSSAQVRHELEKCDQAIQSATGRRTSLFRPPHGGRRPASLRAIRDGGYTPVMWSVSGFDWSAKSASQIVDNVTRHVRGGDVILLHDGGHLQMGVDRSLTVAATDELVRRYLSEGYEFVTVSEMMGKPQGAGRRA